MTKSNRKRRKVLYLPPPRASPLWVRLNWLAEWALRHAVGGWILAVFLSVVSMVWALVITARYLELLEALDR